MDGMRRIAADRGVPWRLDPVLTPRDDGDPGPLAFRASSESVERMFRELEAVGQLPQEERIAGGTNCGLGRTTIAVDPEGNVFPCLQWRRAPLGNVREAPLREMWSGLRGAAGRGGGGPQRQRPHGRRRVAALASFPFCPALALQRTGDPLRPDESHREQAEAAAAGPPRDPR